MPKCKWCGVDFEWRQVNGKPKPFVNGQLHICSQIPNNTPVRTTVRDTGDITAVVEKLVTERLGNLEGDLRVQLGTMVSQGIHQIRQEQNETMEKALSMTQDALNSTLDGLPKEIMKAVRRVVPQEHYIKLETPDTTETIKTRPHHTLIKLVKAVQLRQHCMLVGPAGGGKTTAGEQTAELLKLPFVAKSMGPATTEWDLVGFNSPDGRYVKGLLRDPFEYGGVVMLDEMDNTNPNVLTALNSMLANKWGSFPDGMVKRHPDFVCIGGGNTYGHGGDRTYVGRMQLDGATLDRFCVIDWGYDEQAEFDWAGRDMSNWVKWVQTVRHTAQELRKRVIVSPRASIYGAQMLRAKLPIQDVMQQWVWKGMAIEDREQLERKAGVFELES